MSMLKITTSNSPLLKDLETLMITYQDKDCNISLSDFNKIIRNYGRDDIQIYTDDAFNKTCEKEGIPCSLVLRLCEDGVLGKGDYFTTSGLYYNTPSIFSVDEDALQGLVDSDKEIEDELIKMLETIEKEEKTFMEKTVELIKCKDGQHSLVEITFKGGDKQFVVCSFFDATKRLGAQWDWGHYYCDNHKTDEENLNEALKYMLRENYITPVDIASINHNK